VLIVEDEEGVSDLARRVLEQLGHRVIQAKDGPEALAALENSGEALDLIVSDVIVPDIGTTALEQDVRRRRPSLPILYMSGYSRDEMVERGLVPAGGAFLQKPFTADELSDLVCQQLNLARDRSDRVNT
jgi:DNA-binding NtrC family response regulator